MTFKGVRQMEAGQTETDGEVIDAQLHCVMGWDIPLNKSEKWEAAYNEQYAKDEMMGYRGAGNRVN
jgi:hypothetical protein